jgi:DNA-binding response OmpR family regulator
MTGREITRALKKDPNLQDISIIILSALDDVKDKVAGFEAGIDDYITKPFNFSEVLARINAVLRNRALFDQIKVRETRLTMAEDFNKDLKENLLIFRESIDELDKAIIKISEEDKENLNKQLQPARDKILSVRKHIAALDARIEKTINEWDNLKKDEIGLPVLEGQIRKFLHQ